MQPIGTRLSGRCAVPLLLRQLEVHAAVCAVLRARLLDGAAHADTGAQPDADVSTAATVRMPAGLRKGL